MNINALSLVLGISFLTLSCTTQKNVRCEHVEPKVSNSELASLKNMMLNREFLSGCVTEVLSDACDKLCSNNSIACRETPESHLSYSKLKSLYLSCSVKEAVH